MTKPTIREMSDPKSEPVSELSEAVEDCEEALGEPLTDWDSKVLVRPTLKRTSLRTLLDLWRQLQRHHTAFVEEMAVKGPAWRCEITSLTMEVERLGAELAAANERANRLDAALHRAIGSARQFAQQGSPERSYAFHIQTLKECEAAAAPPEAKPSTVERIAEQCLETDCFRVKPDPSV